MRTIEFNQEEINELTERMKEVFGDGDFDIGEQYFISVDMKQYSFIVTVRPYWTEGIEFSHYVVDEFSDCYRLEEAGNPDGDEEIVNIKKLEGYIEVN